VAEIRALQEDAAAGGAGDVLHVLPAWSEELSDKLELGIRAVHIYEDLFNNLQMDKNKSKKTKRKNKEEEKQRKGCAIVATVKAYCVGGCARRRRRLATGVLRRRRLCRSSIPHYFFNLPNR
jgi:hypothetical protein